MIEGACNREGVDVLRPLRGATRRRAVLIRCGRDTRLLHGLAVTTRSYDLIVNLFAAPAEGEAMLSLADAIWTGGLSKLHAAARIAHAWPSLRAYSHIMLLDPDLEMTAQDVEKVFEMAARRRLALCQPAVSATSFTGHAFLKHRAGHGDFFATNFVEVMAPCFSAAAFERCLPSFDQALSTWGLDFEWAQLLRFRRLGVVNAVQIGHPETPDLEDGAFYRYLRQIGVDPREELRRFRDSSWFRRHVYVPGAVLFPGDLFTPWWRRTRREFKRRWRALRLRSRT